MDTTLSSTTLHENMEKQGLKIKIVPIEHVKALETEIMTLYQKGLLDPDLYGAYSR